MKKTGKQKWNIAYIDGQNLYLGTTSEWWTIDLDKFRKYLKDKYKIQKAYYFIGYVQDENSRLYTKLQESGFIVVFKKQMTDMKSNKKWNIDSDLIFHTLTKLIDEKDDFEKILIVSWDGDFKILVDYLIKKWKFLKILFPNKKFTSSLYKSVNIIYKDYLTNNKSKIEYTKKGAS